MKILKESKVEIDAFIDKFGEDTYNLFLKSKDRLKNNNLSTDISWHTKHTSVEEMQNMLANLQQKMGNEDKSKVDFSKEQIPGDYDYLGEFGGYKVYHPKDAESSMALGVNTGWCTTGRYGHYGDPNFQPSLRDAESHWDDYTAAGAQFYYFLNPKTMYGEWAVAVTDDDMEDSRFQEYIDEQLPYFTDRDVIYSTNCQIFNARDELDYSFLDEMQGPVSDMVFVDNYPIKRLYAKDVEWVDIPTLDDADRITDEVALYTIFSSGMFWTKTPYELPESLKKAYDRDGRSKDYKDAEDNLLVYTAGASAYPKRIDTFEDVNPLIKIEDSIKLNSWDMVVMELDSPDNARGDYYLFPIGNNEFITTSDVWESKFNESPDGWKIDHEEYPDITNKFEGSELQASLEEFARMNGFKIRSSSKTESLGEKLKMTLKRNIEERKERLNRLNESIRNLPELNNDKADIQIDAVTGDAIKSSEERDQKVKDAFKDKRKEAIDFIKAQDKATEAAEEDRAEKRLFLDEDLFEDDGNKLTEDVQLTEDVESDGDKIKNNLDAIERLLPDNKEIKDKLDDIRKILDLK